MESHSMRRESKSTTGSVVKDRRSQIYQFFWWADGRRRSKTLGRFPTKTAAWNAAQQIRARLPQPQPSSGPIINTLVEQYRSEKMPKRKMTRQGYDTWLNHYIISTWGTCNLQELQARPIDLWLQSLALAPKSKVHVRGLVRVLWDFAMWRGDVPMQRNPMELVTIKGASKRTRQPRSLSVEEFHRLARQLEEPFHTIALVCMCFGLRISEALALRWSDVDWLNAKLCVQRGIVHHVVDDVKTPESNRAMHIDSGMLGVLKDWRQLTQFSTLEDWVFASPVQIGRLPISYAGVWRALKKAAIKAGIGHVSSHTFRHTHRSWLDAVGTPVGVQQKLMRHADIRTTMNVYGTAAASEMALASGKVTALVLNGTGSGTEPTSSH
jgi:integrase